MITKRILLLSAIMTLFLTSCATPTYYQVYKVKPADNQIKKENTLIYEDENCSVSYDLWGEGGDVGFLFYNKTNQNIYLNMEESFFVLNGIAHNYYKNRIITNSENVSNIKGGSYSSSFVNVWKNSSIANSFQATNVSTSNFSSGYSVSYNEEKIIVIPSKSSKMISEYIITNSLYRDCDLYKYPTKKQTKSKTFSESDTPLTFSNRIAYSLGKSDNLIRFENKFYVSEISNNSENDIIERKQQEVCGQKNNLFTSYFTNVSPDKFYVKYAKTQYGWSH